MHERAQQAEDRRGCANREPRAAQERDRHQAGDRTQQKPCDARHRVDDDGPRGSDDVRCRRTELAHPHHVEEDVQQISVQPSRAQHCPPSSHAKHGDGAALAKEEEDGGARRKDREQAVETQGIGARCKDRENVERDASADDERNESEIGAKLSEDGRKSPQAGIRAAAAVAAIVTDADQRAARGADNRSGCSAMEHELDHSSAAPFTFGWPNPQSPRTQYGRQA